MSLIHDDLNNPIYVYRVMNRLGAGPYQASVFEIGAEESPWDRIYNENQHPCPSVDFSHEEYHALNRVSNQMFFGFRRPIDAMDWFGIDTLNWMEERGFKLRKIRARKVWLSKSGRQIMFIPLSVKDLQGAGND